MLAMEDALGSEVLKTHIASLPQKVVLLSACTGSGAFELASQALFQQLSRFSDGDFNDS